MKRLTHTDSFGRSWLVELPDNLPDSDASLGIPIGPPSLEALGLPEQVEIALHNQLFARRVYTYRDAKSRLMDVQAAIQGALKLDAQRILELYYNDEVGIN